MKSRLLPIYIIVIAVFALVLRSCGFIQETNVLPNNFRDPDAPFILSAIPPDGSKVDASNIAQVDIVFSEEVLGAEVLGNYGFSGAGSAGLSIDGVNVITRPATGLRSPVFRATVQLCSTSTMYRMHWEMRWQITQYPIRAGGMWPGRTGGGSCSTTAVRGRTWMIFL